MVCIVFSKFYAMNWPVICLIRSGIYIKSVERAWSFRLKSSAKTLFRKPSPRPSPWCPVCGKKTIQNKRQTRASAFETMLSSILYCFILSMQCLIFTKHLVDCSSRLILGTIAVSECVWLKSDVRGTQREILRKKTSKQQQSVIKLSEAIFSILGDCWKKCICSSLPPAQQDWRKSS